MNNIGSVAPGIIAMPNAFAKLASKSEARLLVLSDTHGIDFEALLTAVKNYGSNCDALIFCGDGIADICKLIKLAFDDESFAQKLPKVIAYVRGNNDALLYEVPRTKNAETAEDYLQLKAQKTVSITIASRNILITHGHESGLSCLPEKQMEIATNTDSSIVFFGHSHTQESFVVEKTLFVNPGSLSLPRGTSKRGFAIVSFPGINSKFDIEFYSLCKSLVGYSFNCQKA